MKYVIGYYYQNQSRKLSPPNHYLCADLAELLEKLETAKNNGYEVTYLESVPDDYEL